MKNREKSSTTICERADWINGDNFSIYSSTLFAHIYNL